MRRLPAPVEMRYLAFALIILAVLLAPDSNDDYTLACQVNQQCPKGNAP